MREYSKEDVQVAIQKLFPDECSPELQGLLDQYGVEKYEREQQRVQLAILKLSNGNKKELIKMIEWAKMDYRDVLLWAEYKKSSKGNKGYEAIENPYGYLLG